MVRNNLKKFKKNRFLKDAVATLFHVIKVRLRKQLNYLLHK